ncbi:MAG: sensor histidine kinase, partial [Mobilitalea sp.]
KLNHLNSELQAVLSLGEIESEDASISESIGLINVNKRIKLKYGDNYGIHIESALSKGTQVTINLPLPQNQE